MCPPRQRQETLLIRPYAFYLLSFPGAASDMLLQTMFGRIINLEQRHRMKESVV